MLFAAALRVVIETGTVLALQLRPVRAMDLRSTLEWLGRLTFFLGTPAWLLLRILVS